MTANKTTRWLSTYMMWNVPSFAFLYSKPATLELPVLGKKKIQHAPRLFHVTFLDKSHIDVVSQARRFSKEKYATNEEELQEMLIDCPPIPFIQLYRREWMADEWGECHLSQFGVGDLVFKRPGLEEYLVVETKFMTTSTGTTASTSRTKGRKKVKEQAACYGHKWKRLHPQATVYYAWYTNDRGLSNIVRIPSMSREEDLEFDDF